MKWISLLIAVTGFNGVFSQDVWIQRDSLNGPPRASGSSFVLNDDLYFVAGVDVYGFKRSMVSYDIDQDDWDDEVSLGGESGDGLNRGSAIAFNVGGFGFCGLGTGSATYMKDIWRFDAETETWTQVADFEGSARREAVSFVIDNKAYVGTGQDQNGLTNDFWMYDHELNVWTEIASLPGAARRDAVGVGSGDQGYVGTGKSATLLLNDWWQYQPLSDEWIQKADFPGTPRQGAVAFAAFPKIFIALGEDNTFTFKKDVWEYNYFGDSWTQRNDFPGEGRSQGMAANVKGRLYVGTGYNGQFFDDFYEYVYLADNKEIESIHLNLYPNPNKGAFYIEMGDHSSVERISLFDVNGRDLTPSFFFQYSDSRIYFEATSLSPGTYFVSLLFNSGEVKTLCVSIV